MDQSQYREGITSPHSMSNGIQPSQRKTKQQRYGGPVQKQVMNSANTVDISTDGLSLTHQYQQHLQQQQQIAEEHNQMLRESHFQNSYQGSSNHLYRKSNFAKNSDHVEDQRQQHQYYRDDSLSDRDQELQSLEKDFNDETNSIAPIKSKKSEIESRTPTSVKKIMSTSASATYQNSQTQKTAHNNSNSKSVHNPFKRMNASSIFNSQHLYRPRYQDRNASPSEDGRSGKDSDSPSKQIQFTPLRQQWKGAQPLQSSQYSNSNMIRGQQHLTHSLNHEASQVRLSNQQDTGNDSIEERLDSRRGTNKGITRQAHSRNRGMVHCQTQQVQTQQVQQEQKEPSNLNTSEVVSLLEMEFEQQRVTTLPDEANAQNDSSSAANCSITSEDQCEIVSASQLIGGATQKAQRVPRQDRMRRRKELANANQSQNSSAQPASVMLKSLLEETCRTASKQIEQIENDRNLKGLRSHSRSSHKNRSGTGICESRPQGYQSAKPTPSPNFGDQDGSDSPSMKCNETPSYICPKFEVDLSSMTRERNTNINQFVEIQTTENDNQAKSQITEVTRMNKFGMTGRAPGAVNYIMQQPPRQNVTSLSITRKNRDVGGASESLNKLVQNSVQNLSKILQRQNPAQDRHQTVPEYSSEAQPSSPELPQQSFDLPEPVQQQSQSSLQNKLEFSDERVSSLRNQRVSAIGSSHMFDQFTPVKNSLSPGEKQHNIIVESIFDHNQTISNQFVQRRSSDMHSSADSSSAKKRQYNRVVHQKSASSWESSSRSIQSLGSGQKDQTKNSHKPHQQIQYQTKIINKDLSVIAENEKFSDKVTPQKNPSQHQPTQQPAEVVRKSYLSLTVTAAARKEAIQNSQLQSRRQANQLRVAKPSAVQFQTVPGQSARMQSSQSTLATNSPQLTVEQQQQKLFTDVLSEINLILRIQRAVRRWRTRRKLRALASFRQNLAGVILGYRVRKVFRQQATRALIKETQMMLRRASRQQLQYLRDQHRKKVKILISQLIAMTNGNNPQQKKSQVAPEATNKLAEQTPCSLFRRSDSSKFDSSKIGQALRQQSPRLNTETDQLIQELQPSLHENHKRYLPADARKIQSRARAQTSRQASGCREKDASGLVHPQKDESSRNLNQPRPEHSSTLYKATKSYQMKMNSVTPHAIYESQQDCLGQESGQQIRAKYGYSKPLKKHSVSIHNQSPRLKCPANEAQNSRQELKAISSSSCLASQALHESHSQRSLVRRQIHSGAKLHPQRQTSASRYQIAPNSTTNAQSTKSKTMHDQILSPKGRQYINESNRNTATKASIKNLNAAAPATLKHVSRGNASRQQKHESESKLFSPKIQKEVSQQFCTTSKKAGAYRNESDTKELTSSKKLEKQSSGSLCATRDNLTTGKSQAQLQTSKTASREKSRARLTRSPGRMAGESLLKKMTEEQQKRNKSKIKAAQSSTLALQRQGSGTGSKLSGKVQCAHQSIQSQKEPTRQAPRQQQHLQSSVQVVKVGLNQSFTQSSKPDKGLFEKNNDSNQKAGGSGRSPPEHKRKRTETRISTSKDVSNSTSLPLSLLDLQIANPQNEKSQQQLKPVVQKPPLQNVPSAGKRSGSSKSSLMRPEYPVVVKIASLLGKMEEYSTQLQETHTKMKRSQTTTRAMQKHHQELLADHQAKERLQLERLIIDLRRDFEMSCLEQKSALN